MAVNTISLADLEQLLSQELNDDLEFTTDTDISTTNAIVSTTLNEYDDGADGHFDGWWVEITTATHPDTGKIRQTGLPGTTTYATTGGVLTAMGAAFTGSTIDATCRLHRFDPRIKSQCIIRACEAVFPTLHLRLEDISLITGNILPDPLESFPTTATLTWWTAKSGGTIAQTTTGGQFRYGKYGCSYDAGAAGDYLYLSSDTYPRLLDLQGQTVDAYVLAYPENANDGYIEIYTSSNDGSTTQTLTSSTTNAAGVYTLLKLENQAINDDLDEIQIRLKVGTSGGYVIFESPFVGGRNMPELMLPDSFRDGELTHVYMQDHFHSDVPCYDLNPFATMSGGKELKFSILDEGNHRYIRFDRPPPAKRRLRLTGYEPLETLVQSTKTGTITLDEEAIPYLIKYAAFLYNDRVSKPISAEDVVRYKLEKYEKQQELLGLFYKCRMAKP